MAHLLLVEDSPDVTLIVQRFSGRAGHQVTACPDVPSAWEWLQRGRPDLVLLDLNLPGQRGEELCRQLRTAPALATVPVALLCGWDRPEDIVSGLEAGADHVVAKDLLRSPAAWLARLNDVLTGHGQSLPPSLQYSQTERHPTPSDTEAVNRVLRLPLARQLGQEVLRLVLRRAAERAGVRDWLTAEGRGLCRIDSERRPALEVFVAALAEQVGRLLGTEVARPLQNALADAVRHPGGGPDNP